SRGRHTTTQRELFLLANGGMIIDTPGLRELQLWGSSEGLQEAFDDIEELAQLCRFRDCRHRDEPGCEVKKAVQEGAISMERYESFLKLQKELAYLDRMQDQRLALEEKRKWKVITKAYHKLERDQE
ncbi:MAG: GTPase RsgA, partial [bacterium]